MNVITLSRLHIHQRFLAASFLDVRGFYSCSNRTTASSSVVGKEVEHFDRSTSGSSSTHTDTLHESLPNKMGCTPRRDGNIRSVWSFSFRGTHKSAGNYGNFTVIETLRRTVPVDSYRQYDSDSLSSELRGTHSFSFYLLCRGTIFLCDKSMCCMWCMS